MAEIQAIGTVGGLALGAFGSIVALDERRRRKRAERREERADAREVERLAMDRERREEERAALAVKLRLDHFGNEGRDGMGQPVFMAKVTNTGSVVPMDARLEIWPDQAAEAKRQSESQPIPSHMPARFTLAVPPEWTLSTGQSLKGGIRARIVDDETAFVLDIK